MARQIGSAKPLGFVPCRSIVSLFLTGTLVGLSNVGCNTEPAPSSTATFDEWEAAEAVRTGDPAPQVDEPQPAIKVSPAVVESPALPAVVVDAMTPANMEDPLSFAGRPVVAISVPSPESETPSIVADAGPLGTAKVSTVETTVEEIGPREPKLLIPEQTFDVEGPQGAIRISYDDLDLLKVLNMEPVTADATKMMPSWLKDLDGKRIRVRGFMYPTFIESGITQFVLARDNQICCFGRNPKVYDLVEIALRDGVTTRYIEGRPFDVVGMFHIDLQMSDDEPLGLYFMTDAVIME